MADRKQFLGDMSPDPRLMELLEATAGDSVTEEVLREQKISFAFGNAPADAENITKESVELACENLRLRPS